MTQEQRLEKLLSMENLYYSLHMRLREVETELENIYKSIAIIEASSDYTEATKDQMVDNVFQPEIDKRMENANNVQATMENLLKDIQAI